MKICSVVGARPQFVKAAVVSRALRQRPGLIERLVHTGQHFDANMSEVFFRELDIPEPDLNLGIGGGTHGQNTGRMVEAIERVLLDEPSDWLVIYGDTDSTLAGALAAAKLHIPVAHVEAGLRSFNRGMPEEINRVVADHVSALLLAPTQAAVDNLAREGVGGDAVRLVGDVMYDAALYYGRAAERSSRVLEEVGVRPGEYVLITVHRPATTDDAAALGGVLKALGRSPLPIVWPVHPRTRKRITEFRLSLPEQVCAVDPVGYLDMVMLEKHARVIATDSGGVQKEAFFHGVPCLTLRRETEWVELVELGANHLIGDDWQRLGRMLQGELPRFAVDGSLRPYGSGAAAEAIADALGA